MKDFIKLAQEAYWNQKEKRYVVYPDEESREQALKKSEGCDINSSENTSQLSNQKQSLAEMLMQDYENDNLSERVSIHVM